MAVFVHEFFCSGAYGGELTDNSLAREGLAMLRAAMEDFARCTGERAVTTLDRRLLSVARQPPFTDFAEVFCAQSPGHERQLFHKLAVESEATFVIAPESDGRLLARRELLDAVGGRALGPSADAIRLCSDKLLFSEHLARYGLPAICTTGWDNSKKNSPFPFPIVIKPRDGAGSQDTFLIRGHREFENHHAQFAKNSIVQPFVEGKCLSTAALVDSNSSTVQVFPLGEQRLSRDDRFQYRGGRIPARLNIVEDATVSKTVSELIADVCHSIPGLAGYIGFDLILARDARMIAIIEANPRLTTAYLGYRVLAKENLAARILQPEIKSGIAWNADRVVFRADGRVSMRPIGTAPVQRDFARQERPAGACSGT